MLRFLHLERHLGQLFSCNEGGLSFVTMEYMEQIFSQDGIDESSTMRECLRVNEPFISYSFVDFGLMMFCAWRLMPPVLLTRLVCVNKGDVRWFFECLLQTTVESGREKNKRERDRKRSWHRVCVYI